MYPARCCGVSPMHLAPHFDGGEALFLSPASFTTPARTLSHSSRRTCRGKTERRRRAGRAHVRVWRMRHAGVPQIQTTSIQPHVEFQCVSDRKIAKKNPPPTRPMCRVSSGLSTTRYRLAAHPQVFALERHAHRSAKHLVALSTQENMREDELKDTSAVGEGRADGGVDDVEQLSMAPPEPPVMGEAVNPEKSTSGADNPFDQYYAQLTHQQNMLQDSVRVTAYQRAILENAADFKGKVVLDVGTGSGVLAFFAAQAGARRVYAVEASDVAEAAQRLVEANHMSTIIKVVKGKVEEIDLPEKVDVIVSEPIGFLLVHERMLECYVKARDRFLKPGGKMLPTIGEIIVAPITDETLHQEQALKASFWETQNYYGMDLSILKEKALAEHFGQPVVGYFYPTSIISQDRGTHVVDFSRVSTAELVNFTVPLRFSVTKTALCHGLGCWFDLTFSGSESIVTLSTSPESPQTHWYQCRLMLETPVAVNASQVVTGELVFEANEKHSYFITMTLRLDGTEISSRQRINLQDQMYHYLTSPSSAGQA